MNILTRLSDIKEIPTLPEILLKVKKLVNSDESDAKTLSHLIKQDQALTSKVLRTANSSFYIPTARRISSVPEAITRIGFDEVLRITLAMSIIDQFQKSKNMIGYKNIWQHSLTAANMTLTIADLIQKGTGAEERQDLFLAGLLHDIGIIILDQFFHSEFDQIIQYAMEEEKTYLQSEQAIMPKETHSMIGGALLEIWKLALPVIVAVRYHHSPQKCPEKYRTIVSIVSLTEYILCSGYVGSFEGEFESMDQTVWDFTGINPNDLSSLYHKAENEIKKTDMTFSFDSEPETKGKTNMPPDSSTSYSDLSPFSSI